MSKCCAEQDWDCPGFSKDNDSATFKFYNELNHLFIRGSGVMNVAELGVPKHVDSIFIKDLSLWIKNNKCRQYR